MNFDRTKDPLRDMGIGTIAKIDIFMNAIGLQKDEYMINDDLSVNTFGDVILKGLDLEELPEHINFNEIDGGFYAGNNPWLSLRGFPKIVRGDLQIKSPPSLGGKKFKENEIRKLIKVYGEVWN